MSKSHSACFDVVRSKHFSCCLQHFGKLPKYLQKRIEEEQKVLEEYNNFLKEQKEQAAMTHVSIEKRKAVLKVSKHTGQGVSLQWKLSETGGDQTSISRESVSLFALTIQGLRRTWDQLHREYQTLPLILDTMSQKAHKAHLESKMMQLENDISLIERFKNIYLPN